MFMALSLCLISTYAQFVKDMAYAKTKTIYEVQVRIANACDPRIGSDEQKAACLKKVSPPFNYKVQGEQCPKEQLQELQAIRLGTLEDFLLPTTDYRQGITLDYIKKLGVDYVWVMPIYPDNDRFSTPAPCDNLGSPYASIDYMHVQSSLSSDCINRRMNETNGCWGNDAFRTFINEAHKKGLKVILDVAFNHLGHGYEGYDYTNFKNIWEFPTEEQQWDYTQSYDADLLNPTIFDSAEKINLFNPANLALYKEFVAKCPNVLKQGKITFKGMQLFNWYKNSFDFERTQFNCNANYLEEAAPGFYLSENRWDPADSRGKFFTNDWKDVKFLFHHERNVAHRWDFWRVREYNFRVMNYFVSLGVDGFRMDHSTDSINGFGPNEWRYQRGKVEFYAKKRGRTEPLVWLAEEFHDQGGMTPIVEVMTEGFQNCLRAGSINKDARHVQNCIGNNDRFGGEVLVLSGMENHDEPRSNNQPVTGWNMWTAAGFWATSATSYGVPTILMGEEFGESWQLGFSRSDLLRSRFVGHPNYNPQGDALIQYYTQLVKARHQNAPLYDNSHYFMKPNNGQMIDPRIFAIMKWSGTSVVFCFHNLYEVDVAQAYYIPPEIARQAAIQDNYNYRLFDLISNQYVGSCIRGADLKFAFYVAMPKGTRAQWLRLELCP